jgi:hypothetical protein
VPAAAAVRRARTLLARACGGAVPSAASKQGNPR